MQADAFLFATLVSSGDDVVVERPTYDRTLLTLRSLGANVHMVELEDDGIDTDALAELLGRPVKPSLAHIIPNFQNPAGYTLSRTQARAAARARERARLHDLRGRPVRRHPLRGRAAAADARPRLRRPRRLRVLVLEDRLPRHPRRLPRRRPRADQAHPGPGDEHLHLAEHGRPVDRQPVLPLRRASTAPIETVKDALRERVARARRGARARAARGAVHPARGRLLHVGRAARGHRRRTRCSTRPPTAAWRSSRARDFLLEGGENTLRIAYSGVTADQIDEGVTRLADAYRAVACAKASGTVVASAPVALAREHELLRERRARRR